MNNNYEPTADKIAKTIDSLRANGFEVWFANNILEAEQLFWREIFNKVKPQTVAWGDSLTMNTTEIIPKLQQKPEVQLLETFGEHIPKARQLRNRRLAFSADMFLAGTNAVTTQGQLVNLDMSGNRVAGITFGPAHVVLFIGVNKIVADLEAAIKRVKTIAAPLNAQRHKECRTPCQATGVCVDCNSPQRLCNSWAITAKSYPAARIKIILINDRLGL